MTEDPYPGRPKVQGHCPACGRSSLFLGAGGRVTCAILTCPRPSAVDEILADREVEHVVELTGTGFTVRHPLRERLDDALMDCDLHTRIAASAGPPVTPGRYRVRVPGVGGWVWEPAARWEPDTDETPPSATVEWVVGVRFTEWQRHVFVQAMRIRAAFLGAAAARRGGGGRG
jgi:hypothetical protein